ncbi:Fc receptor-like A [Acipenser ruthenus]|uniref:Fc receptor-like A n=1 Tax=Acipenser ruthenus TaxID=7906 RepID=UPI0027415EFC|nr:Fc receptor-like A [Acipenser ruthenus]
MCPNPILLSVSEGYPKAVLTLKPAWAQIFTGETVTLSCEVEGGFADWRFKQYRDGREEAGCNQWVFLQTPPQPVLEGDSLTLRCRVWSYTATRVVFYKDNEEFQSQVGTELSVARVSKSDEGSYKCRAEWWDSSTYSGVSAEVRVTLRDTFEIPFCLKVSDSFRITNLSSCHLFVALFSRVTLTASPGATVKEGEALNLTCEAAVNKTPRPQLHYTIVRDGEPVTNSTDSALYSIASTEKSHTGSYTCAVESQGVKKSSQELHIEVQTSWHSAAAAAGFSVGFFVILLIVFTLLLLYHKIRGSPCITGGKRRERSDQNQDQAAGGVELSSQAQQPDSEDIVYSEIDTSKHNNTKKVKPAETDTVYSAVKISAGKPTADNAEVMYATVLPKKKRK